MKPTPLDLRTPTKFVGRPTFGLLSGIDAIDPDECYQRLILEARRAPMAQVATHQLVADPFSDPKPTPHHVRVVMVSDTHTVHGNLRMPPGDILIHAGDFSNVGGSGDIHSFCDWLESLRQYETRIVIAGNHELSLDETWASKRLYRMFGMTRVSDEERAALFARLRQVSTFLHHEAVTVRGLKIFGTPYQPEFCNWAFNLHRVDECHEQWASIDEDADILVSHGPPLGHGDRCSHGGLAGCADLLDFITTKRDPGRSLRLHVFGHIHEARGATTDGHTLYVNASSVVDHGNGHGENVHPPMVVDMLPRHLL